VSNGVEHGFAGLDPLGPSAQVGQWLAGDVPKNTSFPCREGRRPGRFGAQTVAVPPGAVEAHVCLFAVAPGGKSGMAARTVRGDALATLARTLNSGRTKASTAECAVPTGVAQWSVVFRYASGPPVLVQSLPDCGAPFTNGTLDLWPATDAAALLESIVSGP
jgi:phage tail protein X